MPQLPASSAWKSGVKKRGHDEWRENRHWLWPLELRPARRGIYLWLCGIGGGSRIGFHLAIRPYSHTESYSGHKLSFRDDRRPHQTAQNGAECAYVAGPSSGARRQDLCHARLYFRGANDYGGGE